MLLLRASEGHFDIPNGLGKRGKYRTSRFAAVEKMTSRINKIAGAIGSLLLFGFMCLTFGIVTTKFTLYDIAMSERLKMLWWHPSYIWWQNPEPEVLLRFAFCSLRRQLNQIIILGFASSISQTRKSLLPVAMQS